MWTYHPDLLAKPVPRYTSYPTAAELDDSVGPGDMAAALAAVAPDADISLYLHIPFCEQICWYCGCNTGAANKAQRLAAYLQALAAEVELVAGRLAGRGRVRRIAFGGGSPNAIPAEDFTRLVELVRRRFAAEDAILSVELDPRGLEPAFVAAMAAAGVTRASLGVQTFSPVIQAAIGRVQPEELVHEAVAQLRTAAIGSINFDLMYGLPGQDLAELADTLDRTIALRPERIALFGYAHVPHLIPRQRRIDDAGLPDAAARFAQAAAGHERLVAAGYVPIGFDHFALPDDDIAKAAAAGRLRRNFQGFTEDQSDVLIGMGASAISSLPGAHIQNEKNSGRYRMLTLGGRLPATRGVRRSDEDLRRGRVIEDLLCRGSADLSEICIARAADALRPFRERGLVRLTGTRLSLSADASPYARGIAAIFDAYRQPDQRRFSNAI